MESKTAIYSLFPAVSCPYVSFVLCGLPGKGPGRPLFDRLGQAIYSLPEYKSARMVQHHSDDKCDNVSRQETTIFTNLGGLRRCRGQAFFDCNLGNKKDTVVPPNGHRIFREITEPITTFSSACYRLCVYASGSLIMVILNWFTLIRLSALHFGQNSGKLRDRKSVV